MISLVIGLTHDAQDKSWLINIGGSFHMTPHKEWFETYHEAHFGRVLRRDSYSYDVVGRGKVRLKIK